MAALVLNVSDSVDIADDVFLVIPSWIEEAYVDESNYYINILVIE